MKRLLIFVCAIIGLTVVDVSSAEARPGWRRRARVTYYAPAQTTVTAEGQPATGNRTYSYQPGISVPSYRSYQAPRKAPWEYQKTDPRRYQ